MKRSRVIAKPSRSNRITAEAQYKLGNALIAEGRLDEAIESYRLAIQDQSEISPRRGTISATPSPPRAGWMKRLRTIAWPSKINPNFPEALNNLGNALAAQGRFDEAIENYRQAIQINPNYAEALDNLGIALATQGRFDEAIEIIARPSRSIQTAPKPSFIWA